MLCRSEQKKALLACRFLNALQLKRAFYIIGIICKPLETINAAFYAG